MSHRTRKADCKLCGRHMYTKGRGLCSTCYERTAADGRLADYAPDRVDRQGQVAELIAEGITTPKAIAERLGITRNAAFMTLAKVRANRLAVVTSTATPPPWQTAIPAILADTPCAGVQMDFDGMTPNELSPGRNPVVAFGLALCASCPVEARRACVDVMDPRGAGKEWQGIAGGVVWSHGRVVYDARNVAAAS